MADTNASQSVGNFSTPDLNASDDDDFIQVSRRFYSIFLPVLIAFTVVTSLVSCLVTCCAPWVKRPMSASVRISLSLSAANTLFAVIWTLFLLTMYVKYVMDVMVSECFMLSLEVVRLGSIVVQVLHLLVVALSHYLGSLRPLHYSTTATPAALRLILTVVWILPFAGMAVVFCSVPGQGYQSQDCATNTFYQEKIPFRLAWSCIFFGPTVVIVLVYCHIFYLLRQRSVYLQDTPHATLHHFNVKMVRLSAMFVVTFLLGWGPAVAKFVLVCKNCLFDLDNQTSMYLGAAFNTLYTLKVFTDTFIYAVRLPAVRKALGGMWVDVRSCGRSSRRGWSHHSRVSVSLRTVSFGLSTYTSSSLQRLLDGVRASIQGHVRAKGRQSSRDGVRTQVETETEIIPVICTPPTLKNNTKDNTSYIA